MTKHQQAVDAAAADEAAPRKVIEVDIAQVAAAKLQITLDRKFGRKTPEIVKMIAAAGDR